MAGLCGRPRVGVPAGEPRARSRVPGPEWGPRVARRCTREQSGRPGGGVPGHAAGTGAVHLPGSEQVHGHRRVERRRRAGQAQTTPLGHGAGPPLLGGLGLRPSRGRAAAAAGGGRAGRAEGGGAVTWRPGSWDCRAGGGQARRRRRSCCRPAPPRPARARRRAHAARPPGSDRAATAHWLNRSALSTSGPIIARGALAGSEVSALPSRGRRARHSLPQRAGARADPCAQAPPRASRPALWGRPGGERSGGTQGCLPRKSTKRASLSPRPAPSQEHSLPARANPGFLRVLGVSTALAHSRCPLVPFCSLRLSQEPPGPSGLCAPLVPPQGLADGLGTPCSWGQGAGGVSACRGPGEPLKPGVWG